LLIASFDIDMEAICNNKYQLIQVN